MDVEAKAGSKTLATSEDQITLSVVTEELLVESAEMRILKEKRGKGMRDEFGDLVNVSNKGVKNSINSTSHIQYRYHTSARDCRCLICRCWCWCWC